MEPRPYQREAIDAALKALGDPESRPLIVAPTGAGKSIIIAKIAETFEGRVCILAHRKELVTQNGDKIAEDTGVWSAGLGRKESGYEITLAGIQSIFRAPTELTGEFDLIIVDEAHLVQPKGGMFNDFFDAHPNARIIGLTATPFRLGTGHIFGKDRPFTEVAYDIPIRKLIDQGFLSPLHGRGSGVVDTSKITVSNGEFIEKGEFSNSLAVNAVVGDLLERAEGRSHVLIFACNVKHVQALKAALERKDELVAAVTGDTDAAIRESELQRFKSGQVRFLVNCAVLTTGFDAPVTDCVAVVRATTSPALWVQMVGRGSRLWEGKDDCLILDYGQNAERHGPVDDLDIKEAEARTGKGGEPVVKACPECGAYSAPSVTVCPECEYEWPERHEESSAKDAVIVSEAPDEVELLDRRAKFFTARSGNPCFQVTYVFEHEECRTVCEFFTEFAGKLPKKFTKFWESHPGASEAPLTLEEAKGRLGELARPKSIEIRRATKGYNRGRFEAVGFNWE